MKKFFIDLVFIVLNLLHEGVSKTAERLRLSTVDPLTGILNRRGGEEEFRRLQETARRHSLPLLVAIIDVDHFKHVNDRPGFGHKAGDEVLMEMAKRLKKGVRSGDVATRWGGEEFAVFFLGGDVTEAVKRLHRFLCKAPYRTKAGKLVITVSIGVSQWNPDESLDTLLEEADAALYEAKEGGRNMIVFAQQD